ncbi:MAG: L-aspartate oxidase [Eubacterium sp.]|nr:L-aspartate oxidase [Eubacterium sp.]
MSEQWDVIVVGTGAAGLFCALNLPRGLRVLMLTKDQAEISDSYLAQGGICVLRDAADFDSYYEDTMRAGHYKNDPAAVRLMIERSPEMIRELLRYGVDFEREAGQFIYTREGAHSKPRILYHDDVTGQEITSKLLAAVRKRSNIEILEYTTMVDLICADNRCYGVVAEDRQGNRSRYRAENVVLATGGLGGLFMHSTNYPQMTGDALAIAIARGIALKNINYIQIHPTTLYTEKKERSFLISESVRGEGGILLNAAGERFVNELLPRDLLTKEIEKQKALDKLPYVRLSVVHLGREAILKRFPNIYEHCLGEGYDLTREPVPVTPAQHYFMGGIAVDLSSKTSCQGLYAVGETSCNGVHGANRLASNSLLESLVFAKQAATSIAAQPRVSRALPVGTTAAQGLGDPKTLIFDEIRRKDVQFYEQWCRA